MYLILYLRTTWTESFKNWVEKRPHRIHFNWANLQTNRSGLARRGPEDWLDLTLSSVGSVGLGDTGLVWELAMQIPLLSLKTEANKTGVKAFLFREGKMGCMLNQFCTICADDASATQVPMPLGSQRGIWQDREVERRKQYWWAGGRRGGCL